MSTTEAALPPNFAGEGEVDKATQPETQVEGVLGEEQAALPEPATDGTQESDPAVHRYPGLPERVVVLRAAASPFCPGGCEVFLVGTAHVSSASCEDVRRTIRAVQPQIVFLELCHERRAILNATPEDLEAKPFSYYMDLIKKGEPVFTAVYAWALGRAGSTLGSPVGEEFRVACLEASKLDAKVALGDRLVSVTVARVWAALSLWDKFTFIPQLLYAGFDPVKEDDIEGLKDADVLTQMILELSRSYPRLYVPLVTERDKYMVWRLHQLAAQSNVPRIVAVVGAGHVPGMKQVWHDDIQVGELVAMPVRRKGVRWGRVAFITGGVFLTGFLVVSRWRRR